MRGCTFFGHADAPITVIPSLRKAIQECVKKEKIDTFFVGTHGNFDCYVRQVLKELKQENGNIRYYIVLAYLPAEKKTACYGDEDTVCPEGIEAVPARFAIEKRNKWMIEQVECVITYVSRTYGGAAKFKRLAERKGKKVLNIT